MEEAVRPCLRCDALVPESRAYCPQCGSPLATLKLVVPRPGAAAGSPESQQAARAFITIFALAGVFGLIALGAAVFGAFM
ncbi:MAG: hypothetical protein ACKVS6_06250 [Planctomycetota bacterium]